MFFLLTPEVHATFPPNHVELLGTSGLAFPFLADRMEVLLSRPPPPLPERISDGVFFPLPGILDRLLFREAPLALVFFLLRESQKFSSAPATANSSRPGIE